MNKLISMNKEKSLMKTIQLSFAIIFYMLFVPLSSFSSSINDTQIIRVHTYKTGGTWYMFITVNAPYNGTCANNPNGKEYMLELSSANSVEKYIYSSALAAYTAVKTVNVIGTVACGLYNVELLNEIQLH